MSGGSVILCFHDFSQFSQFAVEEHPNPGMAIAAASSRCLASLGCRDGNCRQARSRCFPVNGRHVQSVMDNSMMSMTKSKRLAGCNWFFYSVKSFYVFSINIFALIGRRR